MNNSFLCPGVERCLRQDPGLGFQLWRRHFEAAIRLERRGECLHALRHVNWALSIVHSTSTAARTKKELLDIALRHSESLKRRLETAASCSKRENDIAQQALSLT